MKLVLPKEYRGFQFRKLTWFELNDVDVELAFPALYGLIVTGGERHKPNRLRRLDDADSPAPITPDDLIAGLSKDARLSGFDSDEGRALLREWVHSTIAKVGTQTQRRSGETVQSLQPIHLATYAAGLPSTPALRRDADLALFAALRSHMRQLGSAAPLAVLKRLFTDSLGAGVDYGTGQDSFTPRYDGSTPLDLTTLLTLYYLEQFETPPLLAGKPQQRVSETAERPFLIPDAMDALAEDLIGYLATYRELLPASTVSLALVAHASLGLLRYFLLVVKATAQLMDASDEEINPPNPRALEIYADVTGVRNSPSDQLAREAVNRDLAQVGRFFDHLLLIQTLDRIVSGLATASGGSLLEVFRDHLRNYRYDADVLADARRAVRDIRDANASGDEDAPLSAAEFDDLTADIADPIDKLVYLLSLRGSNSGVTNFIKWFRTSGGMSKPYGLLSGNLRGRKNWRYHISDELLSVLVQQAFVPRPIADPMAGHRPRPKVSMQEFLRFLEDRYGILIDRPPAVLDSPETRRAAADNLEALKARLRHMGYFELLSDDFTAQYLRNPLARSDS